MSWYAAVTDFMSAHTSSCTWRRVEAQDGIVRMLTKLCVFENGSRHVVALGVSGALASRKLPVIAAVLSLLHHLVRNSTNIMCTSTRICRLVIRFKRKGQTFLYDRVSEFLNPWCPACSTESLSPVKIANSQGNPAHHKVQVSCAPTVLGNMSDS